MKTIKITLLCCLVAIATNAQNIITIDNSPQSTTTHTTLQAALDAAVAGDIIYVQPTAVSYGSATIDKPITIVGRSHSEVNRVSTAATITVRSSDVTIKGIKFSTLTTNAGGPTAVPYINFKLYECELTFLTLGSSGTAGATPYIENAEIQGCTISAITLQTDINNILIGNNIIRTSLTLRDPSTIVISNNIFRSGNGDITLNNTSTTATAIFYNNMFKTNAATDRSISLNTGDFNFSNCLTYNYGTGNFNFVAANTATFLNNNSLLNTDPLFVDVDTTVSTSFAGSSPTYNPEIRLDDLTLQVGSPALTGGGAGGQIGLFNSGFNYDYLGNPRDVPTMDIINYDAAVPKNGTINVTIKAKAH